jgi:hypothetical protein
MENTAKWLLGVAAVLVVCVLTLGVLYVKAPTQEDVDAAVKSEVKSALSTQAQEYAAQLKQAVDKVAADAAAAKQAELAAQKAVSDAEVARLKAELAKKDDQISSAPAPEPKIEGKSIDNLFLGDEVQFTLDDGDVTKFVDKDITFNDDEYKVHEEFAAVNNAAYILYSSVDEEELADKAYLGLTERGAFEYRFVFDDPIEVALIDDNEPLKIDFLGQPMEIVDADGSGVTLRYGQEFLMEEGQKIAFKGHEVILSFVGENNKVTVTVDGVSKVVAEYDTERIGALDVRAEDILVNNRRGVATIVLGDDTIVDQNDGDYWLDNKDSEYKFYVDVSGGFLESLRLVYNEERTSLDDEFKPLAVGQKLAFPNNYVTVLFEKTLNSDYVTFDFQFDDFRETLFDDTDVDKEQCGLISTSKRDIEIDMEDVSEVFVCDDGKVYFQDTVDDWYEADLSDVLLTNDDTSYELALVGGKLRFVNGAEYVELDTNWVDEQFGLLDRDAEPSDIMLGTKNLGTKDFDVLTPYGAIIVGVQSEADSDTFSIKLPSDKLEVQLLVY